MYLHVRSEFIPDMIHVPIQRHNASEGCRPSRVRCIAYVAVVEWVWDTHVRTTYLKDVETATSWQHEKLYNRMQ